MVSYCLSASAHLPHLAARILPYGAGAHRVSQKLTRSLFVASEHFGQQARELPSNSVPSALKVIVRGQLLEAFIGKIYLQYIFLAYH